MRIISFIEDREVIKAIVAYGSSNQDRPHHRRVFGVRGDLPDIRFNGAGRHASPTCHS